MAVLMIYTSRDGTRKTCDSRCYNAVKPTCECVCAGRNHGVGLKKALQNIAEHFRDIELDAAEAGFKDLEFTLLARHVINNKQQIGLFDEGEIERI